MKDLREVLITWLETASHDVGAEMNAMFVSLEPDLFVAKGGVVHGVVSRLGGVP